MMCTSFVCQYEHAKTTITHTKNSIHLQNTEQLSRSRDATQKKAQITRCHDRWMCFQRVWHCVCALFLLFILGERLFFIRCFVTCRHIYSCFFLALHYIFDYLPIIWQVTWHGVLIRLSQFLWKSNVYMTSAVSHTNYSTKFLMQHFRNVDAIPLQKKLKFET